MNASELKSDEPQPLPLAQQYELLRDEMLFHIKQIDALEFAAAVSIGATYAFLITHKADVPWGMWFIPQVLIGLFGLRCIAHVLEMKRIGEFLLNIEEAAKKQSDSFLGWECFKKGGPRWIRRYDWVAMAISALVWVSMFGGSLFLSLYFRK